MEKRLLLAAVVSLAVLFLWEWLAPKPPRRVVPPAAPAGSPATRAPAAPAAKGERREHPAPVRGAAESLVTISNDAVRATFSNRGAALTSFVLLRHTDDQDRPLELVRQLPDSALRPLGLEFAGEPEMTERVRQALFAVEKESDRVVRFRYADSAVGVRKEFHLERGYLFDVKVSVVGPSYALLVGPGLRNTTEKERASQYVMPTAAVWSVGGGLERMRAEKAEQIAEEAKKEKREASLTWPIPANAFAGLEDNYFLTVLLARQPAAARVVPFVWNDASGKPMPEIAAGLTAAGELDARGYFGPKDVELLESLNLGLERTVDFGWYGILARPLLWLLRKTYGWVGNYGVAILLVTLLIRILLFPLMHKSYASMKKMQKLAPKMNVIRDKYKKAKADAAQRQKMNQELMALYQAEGYNPMSGCFPILLQLPVLVAFYNVLSRSIELRHAPFVFWIRDLAAVDHTYVLLILMIVSMYVQQAMTPSTVDPAQKRIFMMMPLIWGFFLKGMPSGLVLYWLFSNVLTILQQVIINRLSDKEEPRAEKPKRLKQARA